MEKLEECPDCGEVKKWLYDAQICANCGHNSLKPPTNFEHGWEMGAKNMRVAAAKVVNEARFSGETDLRSLKAQIDALPIKSGPSAADLCPKCGGKRVVPDGAHHSGLGKDYGGMYCPDCT